MKASSVPLNAGNSGTTIRLLTGVLAGLLDNASSSVALYQSSATGSVALTNAAVTNSTLIYFNVTYLA